MAQDAKKTKFFCIATEGATTDGRNIDRTMLEQMASNYDPKKYGARINMEHIRGMYPDSAFRAYGDVIALKTDEQDGKLRLLAQLSPTKDLVEMTTAQRQKVYSSMEVDPDFAGTGEAYLVGLAVTDNPASLGTDMLAFSAKHKTFDARKQRPENLFSAAVEADIEFEDGAPRTSDVGKALYSKVRSLLTRKEATDDQRFSDLSQSIVALAESQGQVLEQLETFNTNFAELQRAQQAGDKRHNELVVKLSRTDSSAQQRPTSTGGDTAAQTDC
ncbi:phage capsid protein [Burkholderia stagnalis]|uniref:GPO family capsid scaffolding protein n=1 Tax=Burkholderia stagnalis TaxID=1503054 RepID=UPI00075F97EF|nr:GPO family capsid scaffolding protein [Burkholderia stagnalis]KWI64078.1 phage capsid protein [Burkholderia stagnalis]KWN16681.1 phage capsid protein [Burkholderia stagnalis]KWN37893.1 phage capsid protein [Burkholderia stagnalis]